MFHLQRPATKEIQAQNSCARSIDSEDAEVSRREGWDVPGEVVCKQASSYESPGPAAPRAS